MKRAVRIALVGLVILALTATTAHAQQGEVRLNPDELIKGLNGSFWVMLVVTLVAGAAGGFVYELLILQGNLEMPHKPQEDEFSEQPSHAAVRNLYDLGIVARLIIGALAAVAALLVLAPDTTFGLLATAVVAGSAGTSIFRSMQDRITVAVARQDAAEVRDIAGKQDAKVSEAIAALAQAKGSLPRVASEARGLGEPMGPPAPLADLDEVEMLLVEARGIHQGMQRK